jgi:hypothetical protein
VRFELQREQVPISSPGLLDEELDEYPSLGDWFYLLRINLSNLKLPSIINY